MAGNGQKQSKFRTILWCFISMVFMFWGNACSAEGSPGFADYAACIPETEEYSNIYDIGTLPTIRALVESGLAVGIPTPAANETPGGNFVSGLNMADLTNSYLSMNFTAFQYLMSETKNATRVMPIEISNTDEAFIMVTFLSPLLIQSVYLNDYLYRSQSLDQFENKMSAALDKTIKRGEILFMVTIVTDDQNNTNTSTALLDIPIEKMVLVNADGYHIGSKHYDHNLDQPFESSAFFETGIIGYPAGIQINGDCEWVLNPVYNRNLVIVGDSITTGQSAGQTHTWTIPYKALVDPAAPAPPVNPFALYDPSTYPLNPSSVPPIPPDDLEVLLPFWLEYARFVWCQVVQGY